MMEGLAGSMREGEQPQQAPAPQDKEMAMLQQVVELLMQGVDPEELVKEGVPQEVILQAIEVIEAQIATNQQAQAAPAQEPQGLAQSMNMQR
jgi:predicted dehydrogenase